ncbi:TPA: hypothetical protein ACJTDP_003891, partial [Yersinia enterocolitica]
RSNLINLTEDYRMKASEENVYDGDIRRCLFYARYLKEKKMDIYLNKYTPSEICKSVNEKIHELMGTSYERVNFINDMQLECDNALVKLECFSWFQKNERATYWVWFFFLDLKTLTVHLPSASSSVNNPEQTFPYEIKTPGNIRPLAVTTSHSSRVNAIIHYFDQWSFNEVVDEKLLMQGITVAQIKLQILNVLRMKWSVIFNQKDPFGCIKNRTDENTSWAWRYIKNYKHPLFNLMDLSPVSKEENELALYCAWDTTHNDDVGRKYFLSEFKKAWGQKKFRDNSKNTRVVNTRISNGIKEKLDILAQENNKSIADTISVLIEQEYDYRHR